MGGSERTPPESFEGLVEDWLAHAGEPLYVIDETRPELPAELKPEHRQLLVFHCVITPVGHALHVLRTAADAREKLPPDWRNAALKDLSHLKKQPEFVGFTRTVARGSWQVPRVARVITTQKYLDTAPKSRIVIASSDRPLAPRRVQGKELGPLLNFVRELRNQAPKPKRADVVLDRSSQLGLSAMSRRLPKDQYEILYREDMVIVSDADTGMFRDLLLLPDLAGHLAPRLSREDLAPVIDGRAEFLLLDVDIASLRKKLEDEWEPTLAET